MNSPRKMRWGIFFMRVLGMIILILTVVAACYGAWFRVAIFLISAISIFISVRTEENLAAVEEIRKNNRQ